MHDKPAPGGSSHNQAAAARARWQEHVAANPPPPVPGPPARPQQLPPWAAALVYGTSCGRCVVNKDLQYTCARPYGLPCGLERDQRVRIISPWPQRFRIACGILAAWLLISYGLLWISGGLHG